MKRRIPKHIPTREQLEAKNPQRAMLILLTTAAMLVGFAAMWWARRGPAFIEETVYQMDTFRLYWTLVATPTDRAVWITIATTILAALVLALVLFRRLVWRAFFPDLRRLDARTHAGGASERVGRLYRVRAFLDGGFVRLRHYYKHGDRWLPLFRFDHVDLDEPAERTQHGVALIRCGTLERDPSGNRYRRIPSSTPNGAAPLASKFRVAEVAQDQERKMNIVGPGASMNPEVMRRKYHTEPLTTAWQAEPGQEEA